jgi:hypothetical protein
MFTILYFLIFLLLKFQFILILYLIEGDIFILITTTEESPNCHGANQLILYH